MVAPNGCASATVVVTQVGLTNIPETVSQGTGGCTCLTFSFPSLKVGK